MRKYLFCFLSLAFLEVFPQLAVNPTSTLTCYPNSASANFTISAGTAPYSFTVSGCNSFTASGGANASFSLSCGGVFTFTVKDALNTPLGSITHTVYVNTFGPAGSVFLSPNTITCSNPTVSAFYVPSGTVNISLAWSNGSIGNPATYSTIGVGTVTVTNIANGCISVFPFNVMVNQTPPAFSLTPVQPTCATCCNGQITVSPSGAYTYSLNGASQGSATSYSNLCNGNQVICAQNSSNGCIKCDSLFLNYATGINELTRSGFSIYPNPSSGNFTIQLKNKTVNTILELYNSIGQKVFEAKISDSEYKINEKLVNGIYFLKVIQNNNFVRTQKIIIEN